MRNNKGLSLIELVVVIAILAIATGIGGYALSSINSARSKECAEKFNSALETTRMMCMSKSGSYNVKFYQGTDGVYMLESWDGEAEKIGSSGVSVTLVYSDGTQTALGNQANALTISFNKSSGSLTGADGLKEIRFVGNKSYVITIYQLTGKTKLN